MAPKSPHPKYSRFRFDAGSLALNFVATVRHRGATPRDLLATPSALDDWFRLAGCQIPAVVTTEQELAEALLLREAIYRTLSALVLEISPDKDDVDRINAAAAGGVAVPQFDVASFRVRWESADPARASLAAVARDAVAVLCEAGRERLKMCDNGGCRMLFLDQSPANRRRWCAMSICGNREKVRAHRRRANTTE
jgi:predicted RNA-binding Zn ribbon-like protein